MLVTKREIKKISKKGLSLLLAIMMIMTSMSVCFGTISFAAATGVSDAQWNALAEALANDTVKNATFSGSANNYTVSDPDGKIIAAVEAYYTVFNALADRSPSGSSAGNRTINQVNSSIKSQMSSKMGSNYSAYGVDAFLSGLLAGANVTATGSQQSSSETTSSTGTAPGTNYSVPGSIKLTVMMESAITGYSIDELPASVVTSKSFTVSHKNDKYDYTYTTQVKSEGSGCNKKDVTYYTHKYTYYSYISAAVSAVNGPTVDTSTILTTAATLEKYAEYFAMNMDGLYATEASTLTTVSNEVAAAKKAVVDSFGGGVFTHFFSEYAVETLVSNIVTAKEVQVIAPKLLKAYEDMEAGYDHIITDKAALTTLAATMLTAIDTYNAASAAARAYCTTKGFVVADVTTFRNAVLREIELIELRELIAETKSNVSPFYLYNVDGIADGTVTSANIIEAISSVESYRARLAKYQTADINREAGEDFLTTLGELTQNLNYLKTLAGYEDAFSAEYAKYAGSIFSVTDNNGEIDLLAALQEYDGWYTGLKNLINEMKTVLGEEIANKLFDNLNNVMTDRMDDAYTALNATLEAQIDYAYPLFEAYKRNYGEKVIIATISEYKAMRASIGLINADAYNFLNGTANFELSAEAISKYESMKNDFPEYLEFLNSKGFNTYETNTIPDLERPDTEKDIARENENGVYTTSDEDIEKIIALVDGLLNNAQIKNLLGGIINKDKETGEPTGEPFDLAALITGLIEEKVFSDSLINTIIQFIYPAVANIFTDVWMDIDPWIIDPAMNVMGQTVDVKADLYLYTVEEATAGLGLPIFPKDLAAALRSNYSQFSAVADVLDDATTKAYVGKGADGNFDESTRTSPWNDAAIYTDKKDAEGNVIVNEETGETTKVLNLNWGIDELEGAAKRERFLQAVQAALCGIEPILLALLCNTSMERFNAKIGSGYGKDGLNGFLVGDVLWMKNVTLSGIELDIHTIDLRLNATANDGYNNVIAPLFEMLGVAAPDGKTFKSTRAVIENGLLVPLDSFIAKLAANPVSTLLEILPNLAYAIEADMLLPKLNYLATNISYSAGATINADLNDCTSNQGLVSTLLPYLDSVVTSMTGLTCSKGVIQNVRCDDVMTDNLPVEIAGIINIGELLGGIDLTSFAGIWNLLAGSVELLAGVEAPNAGYLATLGTLGTIDTQRSQAEYTMPNGKAYHITANKADIFVYIIEYVLGTGLIGNLVESPEGILADVLTSLNEDPDIILAAVVELLNQKEYDTLREFDWFDGIVDGESVVGNSAYEVYLNPNNDWTKEKAQYLYEHIDAILAAVLTMAGVDFDLHTMLEEAVGGIFTNETVTALAKLLGMLGDINALIAGDSEETETPEVVAEGEEAVEAPALDIATLLKEFTGLDFSAYAQYADIADDEVIDFGVENADTFVDALVELLAPLKPVVDFLLAGENLVINVEGKKVELVGYNGYNNAIIPLLEALGATDVKALEANDNVLEVVLDALVKEVAKITESLTPIKAIVDILPGVFYYIASKGLSVSVRNLLQPVYVILDTIRPVIDLDLNELINGLLPEDFGVMLNIDDIGLEFVFDLLKKFVPDLDLSALKDVIYDLCLETATEYDSASTLQETFKKGAYSEGFDQADLLTVLISFVLDWATEEENAKALDEMLGIDIIEKLDTVFGEMIIAYDTPVWYYWFNTEEKFNDYIAGGTDLPNTLDMLEYPNDWSEESATFIADNISDLADMVIGLINKDKEDAAKTVSELLTGLVNGMLSADIVNDLIDTIGGLLEGVDANLLEAAGLLLGVDLIGLADYECTAEINTLADFVSEIAHVLNTYASGLVNLLFFGDDYRFFAKNGAEAVADEIVINGGLGYEKGLALLLEVLGAEVPAAATATIDTVLGALVARVEAILADPVNEVLDILPNLVYFLNANGAAVVVNNILAPVYALLEKLSALGVELDISSLLGFDLKSITLADIFNLVEDATDLDLTEAEDVLVDLCFGKIEKADYTYKMVAGRADVVTVLLTIALRLVGDDDFAAKLEELLGTDIISAVKKVFESAPVTYKTPDWYALDESDIDYDNETIGVIKHAITYPNNWTEESAKYIADNMTGIGNMVAGIIDNNYDTLGALLADKVNFYTADTLAAIQKLLGDLIGGLNADLADLVNVGLGAADAVLGADVQGLINYDVTGVKDKETFVAALTGMLMEVEGLVDWLLLGEDYKFFINSDKSDIITINGGHGYANGLALILEALGVENLPDVYAMETIDTETVVSDILTATFNRVDAILADPINEVFNILPNVLYFINSNGLTVAVDNLIGAINALLIKLEGFGLELDIASLVNFSDILGVETELALDNISMEAIIALVAELTGLNLDKIADVVNGFALGRVAAYESVSATDITAKMYYHDDFAKYDMVTVLATIAIITLTDEANAEKVEAMLGSGVYQLILNLINMGEVEVQDFDWKFTEYADTDKVFSPIENSELYEGHEYGTLYTEEMAQYVADNFGQFVNNIIYLLGIEINGKTVTDLTGVINGLLGGSVYNSSNVIAIRDALAGVLAKVSGLQVNGKVIGGLIVDVLKTTGIADINAVANVNVPEFTENREMFVQYLCEVLEPLYGILKYVLADEDLTFFVNADKSDAITLKGAEGYAYGIIPLLETLECKDILTPDAYYAAVEADASVLLTSIIDPLLDRVDEIVNNDPAQAILDMLPNLIYFINSNGVDTVVKNTLAAVFKLLEAIQPIKVIDLYAIVGVDFADINFEWLFAKALDLIKDKTGYEFADLNANAVAELTTGKLVTYTYANGNDAYKMVYADGESGDKTDMVVSVERLLITFIMHENNREMLIGLLKDKLGMSETAEKYVKAVLDLIADCALNTETGMDTALSIVYYIYYGVDTGVGNTTGGYNDLNDAWKDAINDLKKESPNAGAILEEVLGWDIFEDILDFEDGLAPNGLIKFFQKITNFFNNIKNFFAKLFSFGK